jgi:hypothetical protein
MQVNGVYVLWEDPLVLSCLGQHDRSRFLRLKPQATVLCFPTWLQTWRSVPGIVRDYLAGRRHGKSLHFMSCSPDEDRILRRLGIPGALVSQNAYVNEHIFRPTGTAKSFDAVYTAQMQPFKRLQLAAEVRSLFVVTYGDVLTDDGEYDLHRFSPAVAHAEFNRRWISFKQINDVYNLSRVGLALSACEGAMLAAVEYMLAGLPMVSTESKGGRELFFDDRFVSVVEPTPGAVAAGVSDLIGREVDRALVREATLNRVIEHRRKLCAYVRDIIRRTGTGQVPGEDTLYERIFGRPEGTKACYVHSRDFASMGWQPRTG